MTKRGLEKLVWVLIYGGLLTVCVAVFVLRAQGTAAENLVGWVMLLAGAVAAAAGAALIVVRARMEATPSPRKNPRP